MCQSLLLIACARLCESAFLAVSGSVYSGFLIAFGDLTDAGEGRWQKPTHTATDTDHNKDLHFSAVPGGFRLL